MVPVAYLGALCALVSIQVRGAPHNPPRDYNKRSRERPEALHKRADHLEKRDDNTIDHLLVKHSPEGLVAPGDGDGDGGGGGAIVLSLMPSTAAASFSGSNSSSSSSSSSIISSFGLNTTITTTTTTRAYAKASTTTRLTTPRTTAAVTAAPTLPPPALPNIPTKPCAIFTSVLTTTTTDIRTVFITRTETVTAAAAAGPAPSPSSPQAQPLPEEGGLGAQQQQQQQQDTSELVVIPAELEEAEYSPGDIMTTATTTMTLDRTATITTTRRWVVSVFSSNSSSGSPSSVFRNESTTVGVAPATTSTIPATPSSFGLPSLGISNSANGTAAAAAAAVTTATAGSVLTAVVGAAADADLVTLLSSSTSPPLSSIITAVAGDGTALPLSVSPFVAWISSDHLRDQGSTSGPATGGDTPTTLLTIATVVHLPSRAYR